MILCHEINLNIFWVTQQQFSWYCKYLYHPSLIFHSVSTIWCLFLELLNERLIVQIFHLFSLDSEWNDFKKSIRFFLPLVFDPTIIFLMLSLNAEMIIKPSFALNSLSKFWDCPRSNLITCSTNCTQQTQLQTTRHCTITGFV